MARLSQSVKYSIIALRFDKTEARADLPLAFWHHRRFATRPPSGIASARAPGVAGDLGTRGRGSLNPIPSGGAPDAPAAHPRSARTVLPQRSSGGLNNREREATQAD